LENNLASSYKNKISLIRPNNPTMRYLLERNEKLSHKNMHNKVINILLIIASGEKLT
jgi:hypothetical protein